MQIVGFMEDEMQSVLELVAAVLKLGNIEFKPESRCNGTDESRVKDKNGEFPRRPGSQVFGNATPARFQVGLKYLLVMFFFFFSPPEI